MGLDSCGTRPPGMTGDPKKGESYSGHSSVSKTAEVRHALKQVIADLDIKSMIDAPCGDMTYMSHFLTHEAPQARDRSRAHPTARGDAAGLWCFDLPLRWSDGTLYDVSSAVKRRQDFEFTGLDRHA